MDGLRRVRLPALVLVSLVALAGAGVAIATAGHARANEPTAHVVEGAIRSPSLEGTLRYAVWLPRGYARHPNRRYPVLYVLHGLPGGEYSYRSSLFLVPVLERLDAQAIVVFPQGASSTDPDDEYLDLGSGRNWATALTRELPTAVAARYRTLDTRAGRGIVGFSAGGYGAMILGLHNLGRYRVVESWSGYFHATNPDGSAPMPLPAGKAAWADAHRLVPHLGADLKREPLLLAFYTGSSDPYPGFTAENERFARELTSAGVPHRFAVYPGGHTTALWLAHAPVWLRLALDALAPAR